MEGQRIHNGKVEEVVGDQGKQEGGKHDEARTLSPPHSLVAVHDDAYSR